MASLGVEINPRFYRGGKEKSFSNEKNGELKASRRTPWYNKSSLMIFDRHVNLKYKYDSRHFWCRGYYVDTVGRNKKVIAENIRNQLEEYYTLDQMSIKEYTDPLTGTKNTKA